MVKGKQSSKRVVCSLVCKNCWLGFGNCIITRDLPPLDHLTAKERWYFIMHKKYELTHMFSKPQITAQRGNDSGLYPKYEEELDND